ncbi:hypothetical protein V3C99_013603 [Haemonchus contortus]
MKKKSPEMAWAAFIVSVVASHSIETYASGGSLDAFPEPALRLANTEPLSLRHHRKSQVDSPLPYPNYVVPPTSMGPPVNNTVRHNLKNSEKS